MSTSALATLLRLRTAAREESQTALRRAEDERDAQARRLEAVQEATARARSELDPNDAGALLAYHSFRTRQEVTERREAAKLGQRDRELDHKRGIHVSRVRDELAMGNVIEAREQEAEREAAELDARRMDELASRASLAGC